ncbi:MAG: T9SS C-terminal target domain-containing protein [Balneolaceae bacterium]|nr:MAG: T9SS C-terminal target domain-containing protein [Balneolaceae bacterium]
MTNRFICKLLLLPVLALGITLSLQAQTIHQPSPGIEGIHSLNHVHDHSNDEDPLVCTTIGLISSEEGMEALRQYYEWRELRENDDTGILEDQTVTQYEVGASRTFRVRNLSNPSSQNTWDTVQFTLRAKGELTYIWVANDQFGENKVTQDVVDQMMVTLESRTNPLSYFPEKGVVEINQEIFGNPPNIDGSGYLNVLVVDVKDGWTEAEGGSFTAGFFDPVDLNVNNANSNAADIIYIDALPGIYTQGRPANPSRALSVLAHEYQHLIHANYGSLNTFMNEGQSEWAELLNGFPGRGPAYLSEPAELNRVLYTWRSGSADVLKDYQRASLLHSYIAERVGPHETGRITRATQSGRMAYESALTSSGLNFEDVIGEFHTANWVNDSSINGSRFGYEDVRRSNVSVPFGTVPFLPGQTSGEGNRTVNYGGVEYVEWIAAENLQFSLDGDDGIVFHLITKPFNGGASSVTRIQPGNHQLNGEFTSVALVAANTRAQGSEVSPGQRSYSFTSNWTSLPYAIETLNYSAGAAFFAELPGDPGNTDREGIQAYSLRISPNISSDISSVQFIINNRDSGLIPDGDLRIWFGGTQPASGEFIPGPFTSSIDIPMGNLARGSNVIDVSGQNWRVESGSQYHITFEVINNGGAARIEFLLDAGSTNTTDTNYFPARSRLFINPPSVSQAGWFRYSSNNNFLASVNLAGRYDGPSQAPVITTQPQTVFSSIGRDVSFSVDFTGFPTPFIQWRKDGESIPGANGKTLNLNNITQANVGFYSVIVSNFAGSVESNIAELSLAPPEFQLLQNYPNPFNASTTFSFVLPTESNVTLEIYDVTGRRVADIFRNRRYQAGRNNVPVNFSNGFASGVYFYRLTMNPISANYSESTKIRKLMLLK